MGKFISGLIAEGLIMLLEGEVEVVCRAKDDAAVQKCFAAAGKQYVDIIKEKTGVTKPQPKLALSKTKLPETSLGGVQLTCGGGSITIDNTLEARLSLVFEQGMKD